MIRQLSSLLEELKPFFSILIIVSTLFLIVFLQMDERRKTYELLKLTRQHKQVVDEKRLKNIHLARLIRPQQIEKVAQDRLTMRRVRADQIIHLTASEMPMKRESN